MNGTPNRTILNSLKLYAVMALVGMGWVAMPSMSYAVDCTVTETGGDCGPYNGATFSPFTNPTLPSTGTGVFQPFLRTQSKDDGQGYNTDTGSPDTNFDTKPPADGFTRSVKWSEVLVEDGKIFLSLDADETGSDIEIVIEEMQIFIGDGLSTPELNPKANRQGFEDGYKNASGSLRDDTGAAIPSVWNLDGDGDVSVGVTASICDTPGQCGSGHGDLLVTIETSAFHDIDLGTLTGDENFVLMVKYSSSDDGPEEWRFAEAGAPSVPEPSATLLLGVGLLGLGVLGRKRQVQSKN